MRVKNVLTCERALRAYVLTCQRALRAYVSHLSTCLACLCTHVSTCLASSRAHVSICLVSIAWHGLRDQVITCQHASFDVTFFSFAAIVAEVVHTVVKF